jgi:ataxia telangiectasia mutated family protein
MQHWSTAIRLATSPLHSRAACHLLHAILANRLLKYQDVAEDVKSMVTLVEISAPAVLCDASLSLMIHLLHIRNTEVPGGSFSVSQNVIRWLFAKWNPGKLIAVKFIVSSLIMIKAEKSGTRYSIDIHPIDILNIIRASLDLPSLRLSVDMTGPTGSIGQAWLRHLHNTETLRYLLLLDDVPENPVNCSVCRPAHKLYLADRLTDSSSNGTPSRRLVVELILPRFAVLLGDWQSYNLEHIAQLSSDFVRATTSACITGCLISTLIQDQGLPQLAELDRMIQHLTGFLASFRHSRKHTRTLVEAILQGVQPYFPAMMSKELAHLQQFNTKLWTLFDSLAQGFGTFPDETTTSNADDPMDLDDIFETQQSRSGIEKYGVVNERGDLAMSMSPSAFYYEVSGKLVLVSGFAETPKLVADIPSTFIDHFSELSVAEALFSRHLLQEILRGDLSFAPDDAVKLLATTETILAHQYACCEVSQGLCIDMMIGLLPSWARDEDGDLADSAFQLYSWLINLVVPKRRPSPNVQIAIAKLLYELMRIQPVYGESQSLPSARSSLFDILSKAPVVARFRISQRVPDIFNLFVLKHHIDILNDVLETLPLDPEWAEGNAFRLYVLSKLASRWPTLLRRCVYYILEVGKLPQSIPHAARCLSGVSKALNLDNERELFKIFGSQLLFTWLESEDLNGLPYAIFGYHSLEELLKSSQDEISALMVMRNQDEAVALLAAHLGITMEQLLEKSFTKVISYSVAHDISIPPTDTSKKYVSGEARVRKILGKERWFELINLHFVDIIAMLFKLIDREQDIEKIFSKDPSLHYAVSILRKVKQFSASESVLPPNHQPTFKARYLTNEIEHICKRTEFEVASLYTPAMVVFIARSLLTSIHPALGSLHTCAILRKLRVLIALAGPGALSGYPLEMLLQSIGSLVTDTECADDAIGILQYLLTAGDGYLSAVPSFVAGFAVLLLASLRIFLNSTPSSTTLASQYLATVSKAESFHSWLGARFSKYEYPRPESNKANAFKSIVDAAGGARSMGNAEIGTFESKLLLELLKDKQSTSPLLDRASRERAFSLLYSDFEIPKSYRADIFGEDIQATRYSNAVLDFCKSNSSNPRFLAWGGKVLGRAFVSTGYVQPSLLQESSLRSMLQSAEGLTDVVSSKASILRLIQSITLEDSRNTVGLAESALRLIINQVEGHFEDVDGKACSHTISEALRVGSNWSPYQTPPSDRSTLVLSVSNDSFSPVSIETEGWLQDLALTLVKSVPKDATLYPLQALLTHATRFAENAFPFILHIVLNSELDGSQNVKSRLSKALRSWLPNGNAAANRWIKLLINAILYLRTQPLPNEASIADRTRWLDIDYLQAAEASIRCGMYKTALLFTEVSQNDSARSSRRASNVKADETKELLFRIYKNVDDPDLFYGLQQTPSLSAVSGRLEFEKDGLKSLMFKGAEYDSRLRQCDGVLEPQTQSLVGALGILSLDGISHSLLQSQQVVSMSAETVDSMFHTARRLEQWDLPIPQTYENDTITVYKTLQTINNTTNPKLVLGAIEDGLTSAMSNILQIGASANAVHKSLQALAILTEIDEVLNSSSSEQFEEMMERFQKRSNWMKTGK